MNLDKIYGDSEPSKEPAFKTESQFHEDVSTYVDDMLKVLDSSITTEDKHKGFKKLLADLSLHTVDKQTMNSKSPEDTKYQNFVRLVGMLDSGNFYLSPDRVEIKDTLLIMDSAVDSAKNDLKKLFEDIREEDSTFKEFLVPGFDERNPNEFARLYELFAKNPDSSLLNHLDYMFREYRQARCAQEYIRDKTVTPTQPNLN